GGVFQVAFGVGGEQPAGGAQRAVLADAGQDVLQRAAFGNVIEDVVGGEQSDAEAAGYPVESGEAAMITGAVNPVGHQPHRAREGLLEVAEGRLDPCVRPNPGNDTGDHALAPREEIAEIEKAGSLPGPAVAEGEQTAEAAIGGPIGRPGKDV